MNNLSNLSEQCHDYPDDVAERMVELQDENKQLKEFIQSLADGKLICMCQGMVKFMLEEKKKNESLVMFKSSVDEIR